MFFSLSWFGNSCIFLKWINEEHVKGVLKQGVTLTVFLASFTMSFEEYVTARTAYRAKNGKDTFKLIIGILGLVKQTGDICFNNPSIQNKLIMILGPKHKIIKHWNKISITLS